MMKRILSIKDVFYQNETTNGDNAVAINGGAHPRLEVNEENPQTRRVNQEIEPDR